MLITILILVVLGLCILAGYYRGVIYSAVSIGLTLLSFFLALLLIPVVASPVRESKRLYGSLLYYFEGYEFVSKTSVELIHDPVSSIDGDTLSKIIDNADLPRPLDSAVGKNIRREAYRDKGITTLGDYFNQTIVDVVLNIISLLFLFVIIRVLLGFILRMIDYGRHGLPTLKRFDPLFSCGIGFLHGVAMLYIFFLLAPIVLTIVPRLGQMLVDPPLAGFFYRMNPFMWLIPTT
ncbi:MAG: CvpA family protein [Clostridia bacterium]|nr:CvpA family protein [Clostridia bacterium]